MFGGICLAMCRQTFASVGTCTSREYIKMEVLESDFSLYQGINNVFINFNNLLILRINQYSLSMQTLRLSCKCRFLVADLEI